MGTWDSWIGREERRHDQIEASAFARWIATLDRASPTDDSVPMGYHWCLCLPDAPTASLGLDGHPFRDDGPASLLPPVPLPRRMWASSKVEFHTPLYLGQAITRTSRVVSITEKSGSSGQLVFVEVEHETAAGSILAVRETQVIVYRGAAMADAMLSPPSLGDEVFDPAGWDIHRVIIPGEPLLFRFSALTFNSHRIHYDLPYAQGEERYRGLVVHGPLTATLLLDLVQREMNDNALATFAFRGLTPAICGEALHLVMRGPENAMELAAFAADGRQVMTGSARKKD
ncbi:MAG: MaoC family dehydratase N-terminal domain-containing protein [Sphingorhabdus sp.]